MTDRSNAAFVVKLVSLTRSGKLHWTPVSANAYETTVSNKTVRVVRDEPRGLTLEERLVTAPSYSVAILGTDEHSDWQIFDVPAMRDLFTAARETPPPEIQETISYIMNL